MASGKELEEGGIGHMAKLSFDQGRHSRRARVLAQSLHASLRPIRGMRLGRAKVELHSEPFFKRLDPFRLGRTPVLTLQATGDLETSLAFYRDEYVLTTDPDGQLKRSDFLRGPDGKVAWLRDRGRLWAKQG